MLNSIFNINLLKLEKRSKTGKRSGNYVKIKFFMFYPKVRQFYIHESGIIRPICRGDFHFGNIQSSQNDFHGFFKMTVLTFWSFMSFSIFFMSKLSACRPCQIYPKIRKVRKVTFRILDLDFQRFSGGRFSKFTKL